MHHQLDFCYLVIVLYITQYHWNKKITVVVSVT